MKAVIRIFTLVLTLCMLLSVCAAAAAAPEASLTVQPTAGTYTGNILVTPDTADGKGGAV